MEEKIRFDKQTGILKSNINLDKYHDLFRNYAEVVLSRIIFGIDYGNELSDIERFNFNWLSDYDLPTDFNICYTKRSSELDLYHYIYEITDVIAMNAYLQKKGQVIVDCLKQFIADCTERHISMTHKELNAAYYLQTTIENFLHVLSERAERFHRIAEEIKESAIERSMPLNDLFQINNYLTYTKKLAEYYYGLQDYSESLRLYLTLYNPRDDRLKLDSQDCYLLPIGCCYLHLNRVDEALQAFQKTAEKGELKAYIYAGDCYLKMGKTDEALQIYQKAIDAGETAGYIHIGDYRLSLNQIDEALQLYRKAICSGNPEGYDHIADYYKSIGNTDKAFTWYEKGLYGGSTEAYYKYNQTELEIQARELNALNRWT